MFKKILNIRFFILLGVAFTLINALLFIIGGALESIKGYMIFYQYGFEEEKSIGIYFLKGLDFFLVGIVFMIFALGIMKIFTHDQIPDDNLPEWLKIKSFKELKILLWETILLTMVVFCLTLIRSSKESIKWDLLVLPAIILVLTVSFYLVKGKKEE
ncbi:YqhA family protein [Flavihumibacter profundi]|uniref:YqhA family protein n=1 Tax=Flavihumibacter profundi TaxID=2716883 RepID=UPI001CC4C2CF|nr:YqhA family protein [Flavihumibacter profundi]MBZ5856081.1 YqhA family protein [Flavihumibacter profundi]